MTTLVLLMLILTSLTLGVKVGVPAARQRIQAAADRAPMRRWQRGALGLVALTFVVAHVAHEARAPYAVLAAGQDEIVWAARHQAQLPGAAAAAGADAPAWREGE